MKINFKFISYKGGFYNEKKDCKHSWVQISLERHVDSDNVGM